MVGTRRSILRCMAIPLGLLLLFFSGSSLFPESKKAKKESATKSRSTIRVPVNVVVVNATVTDRAGNPVTDLTSSDFRVYDDGKPQSIQTFALESDGLAEAEGTRIPGASPERATVEKNETRPRLISILIDDLTMGSVLDFPRMIDVIKEFIKKDVSPKDHVAILSGSRNVQFPFSDDKQRLLEELSAVPQKLNLGLALRPECLGLTDLEAWRISIHAFTDPYFKALVGKAAACLSGSAPSDTPEEISRLSASTKNGMPETFLRVYASAQNDDSDFRTRKLLYTILQNIRALRHFEGTRTVVFFSDGFLAERGTAEAYQLQELVELALHSGIVLNSVSTRGIPTYSDYIFSSDRSDIQMLDDDRVAQESPLSQMASETGGQFFHNSNNMYKGLRDIVHHQAYYYILTYAMPPQKADGSYHHIKLEVTRPGLELSYRKGYYTPKEELKFENRKKEDILGALSGPGNMKEIPITLAYAYSQEDDSAYAVSFVTNVNIRGLQFIEEDARRKNTVSLVLVAFDESDHYINGLEKSIDFRLLESSYASLRKQGLKSRVELKLPFGRYKIKVVVRESNQGKMGSVTKTVEIP